MGGYHWTEIVVEPALIYLFVVFAVLVPVVSLHFYLVFPRINPIFERNRRATYAALYGVPAGFIAASGGACTAGASFEDSGWAEAEAG